MVYPPTYPLPGFSPPVGQVSGGDALRRRTHYVTTNVAGVRDYVPGDSFNRIHWPSTARTNRLIVKEFELDPLSDVWLMLGFGVAGYLLRKLDDPMAPAVLAIVLGPLAETSMRQSLLMSHGEFGIFFTRPVSGPIMIVAILLFLLPVLKMLKDRMRKPAASNSA